MVNGQNTSAQGIQRTACYLFFMTEFIQLYNSAWKICHIENKITKNSM